MRNTANYNTHFHFNSFQSGEEKGYHYFFKKHYNELQFFVKKLLKDESLAEDVVADCFVKLFEKRMEIRSEETIRGFLYAVARNACKDRIKHKKVQLKHQKQSVYLSADFEQTAEQELIRTETLSLVLKAMEDLPPATRKVFQMHFIEGKNYDEIAAILNRSKKTIRKQKQTGLTYLKRRLLLILIIFSVYYSLFTSLSSS